MASHLSGGRLNVALLHETSRNEFFSILQNFEGPKVVMWDEWLASPIGLVAPYALLLEHDVITNIVLKVGVAIPPNIKHIIFVTRPRLELIDIVADNIFSASAPSGGPKKEFHLIYVPRKSDFCEKHLTNKGVLGSLTTITEFKCDVYPLDSDLLSLELLNDFRDFHLDGDPTCLFQAASAIGRIQQLYGTIPKVLGKGPCAKQVWDLMCRQAKEEQATGPKGPAHASIDALLLLDRSIDLTSVLATQLTYEGLIDELFGIKCCAATFPKKKFLNPEEQSSTVNLSDKTEKIILNSNEELFVELRDKNFTSVGSTLSRKAHMIHNQLGEKQDNKSVQEIRQFVSRLPHMLANKQSLATHTAIAEYIKEITDSFDFHDNLQCEEDFLNCIDTDKITTYIEDLMAQKAPLTTVLRLICLQCVTGSGLKPKVLDHYKRELVQVYGLQTWLGISNLEKAGILKAQTGTRQYTVLRKALRLTVDETADSEIKEKSYLSSCYTPLSVRLAEHLSKNKGWFGLQDVLGLLPGPTLEEAQSIPHGQNRRNSISSDTSSISEASRVILVFFLGGCTFSEVSALRALSQQEDSNVDFVLMTTKMINGNTFIESIMEP